MADDGDGSQNEARIHRALRWIVELFRERDVPYQLVGGLAARAYGATRPIADIDFYVSAEGFERIRADLEPFVVRPMSRYEDDLWSLSFTRLEYEGQAIELGLSEAARFRNRERRTWADPAIDFGAGETVEVLGVGVRVMPRSSLISYKRQLGRSVDRMDLEQLEGRGGT